MESGDTTQANHLAGALYFLQRMNADRLNDLMNDYRPEPFTKNWGADPEYKQLMRQLHTMSLSLEDVSVATGKKNKKK